MWTLGLGPRSFFSGNIQIGFIFSAVAKNHQTDLVAAFIFKKQDIDVKLGHDPNAAVIMI